MVRADSDTDYQLGLPPEKLRRSVSLWQARLTRQGERPFMLWFTVDEFRLPKEAAHRLTTITAP